MAQKTPEPGTEEFATGLPRSMDGEGLRILSGSLAGIVVTDGTRTALYVPQGEGPGLRGELQVMNCYSACNFDPLSWGIGVQF
jgi:hypothetical protein